MKDELEYVNCLLTVLARGTAKSVTLTEGAPLPNPAHLTADPADLQWVAEQGFNLDRLSTARIMLFLLKSAGFRWFHPRTREGQIKAKVVAHGGETARDVTFRVWRQGRGGGRVIEITSTTE